MSKLPKKNNNNESVSGALEEYSFIANCLKMGLTLQDLKELEYKDVMKIMLCYTDDPNDKNKTRKATQNDWDKLAGRR